MTGASYRGSGKCVFSVWAPFCNEVVLRIVSPEEKLIKMERKDRGFWSITTDNVYPGTLYFYRLNNAGDRPDPASNFQPQGVHGPSQVEDHSSFIWNDSKWKGLLLKDYIIYELHTGAFTREGTFDAAIRHLDYLDSLGVTAIELMPVAQFPGSRNWGYDGVYPYAPQNSYGGPEGLKRLVNACHEKGIAVVLDVVYNHLGPEGNYLGEFGPYFTDKYRTPWGNAINFDGPHSDIVKDFFISSALYWITEYHVDALRIDAIHGIFDFSAKHFIMELAEKVHSLAGMLDRSIHVIAESDLNDVKVINPVETGGYGLDAQWNDDFHHALHTLLTGETIGYYQDFGRIEHMVKAFSEGFVYSGQYSPFRARNHGNSSKGKAKTKFVVFSQNHDQVGNRAEGDRLCSRQLPAKLRLAGTVVLLSPFIPLIFMGEEYGETAPFQYFISHSDERLIKAVRRGRRREFTSFAWKGPLPDPQAEKTFFDCKVNIELSQAGFHGFIFRYYRELIRLRKELSRAGVFLKGEADTTGFEEERVVSLTMRGNDMDILCIYSFNEKPLDISIHLPEGLWKKALDSSAERWGGAGETAKASLNSGGSEAAISLNPYNALVYSKKNMPGE